MSEKGVKFDSEKPDLSLLPKDALIEITRVLEFGARRYGRDNFKLGIEINRLIAAAMRHILSFNEGETLDPDSGLNHAAHAATNLMFVLWMLKNKPEMDNRYGNK